MSDAYGSITATLSIDFKGDIENLCALLNRFSWSNDGEQWIIAPDENLMCFSGYERTLQYPKAFPNYRFAIDVNDENHSHQRIYNPTAEQIIEAFENGDEVFEEDCDLEMIVDLLGPHIHHGWIEIAIFCRWKDESFIASTLLIDDEFNSKLTTFYSGDRYKKSNTEVIRYQKVKSSLQNFMSGIKQP